MSELPAAGRCPNAAPRAAGVVDVRRQCGTDFRVRAVRARSERVRDKVEEAYAAKYDTTASQKYVRGFETARRGEATMEFRPR